MKIHLWLKLGLALLVNQIFAQPENILFIDETGVEAFIMSNNINLKGAQIQFNHAKRSRDNMWNEFMPKIEAGVRSNRVYGPNQALFAHGNASGGWFNALTFNAFLDLSSWVWMGMLKTQYQYEAGELSYEHAKQQLKANGLIFFYSLLLSRENLNLVESSTRIAHEAYQQSLRLYNNGILQQLDLLDAEVSYQNQKNQYEQLRINYEQSILEFKQLLGIPLSQDIVLLGNINIETYSFDTEQMLHAFSGKNLAIQQAFKQQIANEWDLWFNHATAAFRPFVSLDYSAQYTTTPLSHLRLSSNSLRPINSLSFTLGFTMQLDSILPWSKTGLNLWQARDQFRYKTMENEEALITNEREIINQTEQLNNIVERLVLLSNTASVSERALELTSIGYNQGVRTQLELDQSLIRRNEARLNLAKAKFEYFKSLQELSVITGQSSTSLINFARVNNQLNTSLGNELGEIYVSNK